MPPPNLMFFITRTFRESERNQDGERITEPRIQTVKVEPGSHEAMSDFSCRSMLHSGTSSPSLLWFMVR